jgi:hypothetical protein
MSLETSVHISYTTEYLAILPILYLLFLTRRRRYERTDPKEVRVEVVWTKPASDCGAEPSAKTPKE